VSQTKHPALKGIRKKSRLEKLSAEYEYSVKIVCPWCGGRAGEVSKRVGEEEKVLLLDATWTACADHCDGLRWPSVEEVQRLTRQLSQRPYRAGKPFGGRNGRIVAHRVPAEEIEPGMYVVRRRGDRLGT
jgi:hypothetical protein